jgi:Tol biopolymer transport system component
VHQLRQLLRGVPSQRRTFNARRLMLAASLVVIVGLVAGLDAGTESAQAAFPGSNGKIVFTSNRNAQNDIYVMNEQGGRQTRLTTDLANDTRPRWSASGRKIAFASRRDGNFEIYSMNGDGSNQTRLTNDPVPDNFPSWTADDRRIVFQRGGFATGEIYAMNADGTDPTNLTNDPAPDITPATAPRGTKIVFGSTRGGSGGLFTMEGNGSELTRLTTTLGTDWVPNWSPSGREIVFLRDETGLDDDIYVVRSDGTRPTRLTNTPTRDEVTPVWSPDRSRILFGACGADGNCQLHTIKPDGSHERQLTSGSFGLPPGAPYLETFDNNTINPAFWQLFDPGSSSSAAALVNQRLEMSMSADAIGSGFFGIQAASRCLLQGDFDLQVDYILLDWPTASGIRVALGAEPDNFVARSGATPTTGERYFAYFPAFGGAEVPTNDQQGSLRLVRSGISSTAYVLSSGIWTPILTATTNSAEEQITLTFYSSDFEFGHQNVKAAFDNFRLNSGSFDPATCIDLRNNFPDWQAQAEN